MEASAAFHRCLWQAFTRPTQCRHLASNARLATKTPRQQIARTSSRTFVSTSQLHQDSPPQPIPVSNAKNTEDAIGAVPRAPARPNRPSPDPNNRIDLSSLQGNRPSSNPQGRSTTGDSSANPKADPRTQLNALFGAARSTTSNTSENRFQRTIRETDAQNRTPLSINIANLIDDADLLARRPAQEETKYPLRLKPTLGKTLTLDPNRGIDLTRAFRSLETKCSTNNVKRDFNGQRFHVRKGLLKKINRMLRWRKVFKAGFIEECARVRRMQKQGW